MDYKQEYRDYILSESWFKKRKEAFKYYGRKCKKCFKSKKLHVHHKTYENFTNEVVETDLTILCEKCHNKYHSEYKHTSIETTNLFINKGTGKNKSNKEIKKEIKKKFKPDKKRKQKVDYLKGLLGNKKIQKHEYFELLRKL